MNIWFTSDTHFNHVNILSYANKTRPWNTIKEMNTSLISSWNDIISDDDIVYHLGDFILGQSDFYVMADILQKLNGQIKLIPGNHDTRSKLEVYKESGIEILNNIHELKTPNIVLCHFPLAIWHNNHHGSWHLHGHCHGSFTSDCYRMDVGVDTHPEHRPYHLDEIKAEMSKRNPILRNHHEPLYGD